MRLGFIGPCRGDLTSLRALAERLLFDLDVQRVVYLGADDALDKAARGWPERFGAAPTEAAFLAEAAALAPAGAPEAIEALLDRDRKLQRLGDLAALPPPPSRAIEMFDDRVVLMVFDKGVLDEDDVANATAIVWGNSQEPVLKPIGPRIFFSPGWVTAPSGPHAGVVTYAEDALTCRLYDKDGKLAQEHRLSLARGAKMGVQ
ncbi:MAG: hypothetical protein WCJ30_23485 [Deltaproteobacteria bacterium]